MKNFPKTAEALARLLVALEGWNAARRRQRALRLLAAAVHLDGVTVMQASLAAAARAGFTLHKDGQEFGVFLAGVRVTGE